MVARPVVVEEHPLEILDVVDWVLDDYYHLRNAHCCTHEQAREIIMRDVVQHFHPQPLAFRWGA